MNFEGQRNIRVTCCKRQSHMFKAVYCAGSKSAKGYIFEVNMNVGLRKDQLYL